MSKYGAVPPSEKEIINAVTENNSGLVIGYKMYNDLKLTTQISKNVEVLSSTIDSHTKNISNVKIKYVNIDYTEDVKNIICGLEVLQNFNKIQDINYSAFIDYSKLLAKFYKDEVFETVISKTTYKKSTIAFFKNILNYYKISNNLDDYLSSLSIYKHPKMEELYEIARISN